MVRYPYTIEALIEQEAKQNQDGSWFEGEAQWCCLGRCNARQNGAANEVVGNNGKTFVYAYEIVMPANSALIPIGTHIKIKDNKGHNIFNNTLEHSCTCNDNEEIDTTYQVIGYYKSGQRNEDITLWV